MVLGSLWRLIKMRNLSSPTVIQSVTPTPWTAAPCGSGITCTAQKGNRNHKSPSVQTKMATSPVIRTTTNIETGNVRNPKKSDNRIIQISLTDVLPNAKTTTANAVVIANMTDCMGVIVHLTATKQSRDVV